MEGTTEPTDVFGLDRDLITIKTEHTEVITSFMEQHRARGLIVKQNAEGVAASVQDAITAQDAANWIGSRKAEKADIIKGPLGFWRNLFHQAHLATKTIETELTGPYDEAIRVVDLSIGAWRRKDAAERAEADRIAKEELRKREEDLRLQAAQKLEEKGQHEAADRVLERPMIIPAPVVQAPKLKNVRVTRRLVASCATQEDKWLFIKDVVERGPGYASMLDINFTNVEGMAKSLDGNLNMKGITLEWQESQSYGNGRRQVSA